MGAQEGDEKNKCQEPEDHDAYGIRDFDRVVVADDLSLQVAYGILLDFRHLSRPFIPLLLHASEWTAEGMWSD
jgi:hypothetical protein